MITALLVEDSEDDVVLMRRMVKESRLDVKMMVIREGELALDFLTLQASEYSQPNMPKFVLLDLSLQKVGGMEILRRMKSEPVLADIPVIILSGTDNAEEIRQGQRLNAHTHITKPMSSTEFSWIVRSIESYWPRLEVLRQLQPTDDSYFRFFTSPRQADPLEA